MLFCLKSSLIAQFVKNPSAMQETIVRSWVGKICWRRDRLPTPVLWPGEFMECMVLGHVYFGLPGVSDGTASACNVGDPGSRPGSGRSLEKEMATHASILAWRIP